MNSQNKHITLVTGGSRGIGKAIAMKLGSQGMTVIINYHSHRNEAEDVCTEINSNGGKALAIQADVSKSFEVSHMMDEIHAKLGEVDILINNAGIAQKKDTADITEQDWDHILNTNLKSSFLITQAVLPSMKKHKWGRIINISSAAAFTGGLVGPHYTASKAGMIGLTRYYAKQLVKEGITVNAIAPAIIETEMVKKANLSSDVIPMGRFGKPEEIANSVLFIIDTPYLTGQTLEIDGGLYFK